MPNQEHTLYPAKNKSQPPKRRITIIIILLMVVAGMAVLWADNIFTPTNTATVVQNTTNTIADKSYNSQDTGILAPIINLFTTTDNKPVVNSTLLGTAEEGSVSIEGPIGNQSSNVTIAYIIGQHPRESDSHQAIEGALINQSESLHYKYYIYKINVTKDPTDFTKGRMNGQLLAQQFVVPDVQSKHYRLVCDVHSSNGFYYQDPYIFTPGSSDTVSKEIANNIVKANSWLYYYEPPEYSSPKYCTEPIVQNGTPAVIFEAHGQPGIGLSDQINQLVKSIDNLKS
ncbi:MAG: hypothetical protein K1X33_05880 [Methanobacteriaceae archaeon]|nr:hypothetical protein [Methanobacteriaceae archaeon]